MTAVADPFAIPADLDDRIDGESPTEPIELPERRGARLTPEQMAEKTEEYPYGRRADGSARQKPGPRMAGAPRPVAAPKPRKTTKAPAKSAVPDYRPGILGLLQIPVLGLTMFGRQSKNAALQADGYALSMHAPGLAEALNETAKTQPAVGRALESLMKAGPYGALIGAVIPLAMQLAANHGIIPANPAMGIHATEQLVAASNQQLAEMAAAGGVA